MNHVIDHLDDVVTEAFGPFRPSPPMSYSDRSMKSGAHISSWLSFEKDASKAPATVPVASSGTEGDGDHANVAVRCTSLSFIIVLQVRSRGKEGKGWRKELVGEVKG